MNHGHRRYQLNLEYLLIQPSLHYNFSRSYNDNLNKTAVCLSLSFVLTVPQLYLTEKKYKHTYVLGDLLEDFCINYFTKYLTEKLRSLTFIKQIPYILNPDLL